MKHLRYYIIEADTWRYLKPNAEPLDRLTFFEIYAGVFSSEQIDELGCEVVSFEQLDEVNLSTSKRWAVETMDVFTRDAITQHHQHYYSHLMRNEEQRNDFLAIQRARKPRKPEQLSLF